MSNGVTSVPFLSQQEVEEILEAYWCRASSDDHGLTIDYMRPERDLVRSMSDALTPVLSRHLDEVLVDHKIVLATFVVKHPGESSAMFLHDDRSYVDERKFRAATLWIPLVDVGPTIPNGGLQVVPGSHLLPTGWAGSNTPDLAQPFEADVRKRLAAIEASAGTAVVYDTRVLHASEANLSDVPRVAVACAVAPIEADLFHIRAIGRRTRHLHSVDDDFFLDHHPREIEQSMPDDCPLVEILQDETELSAATVTALLGISVDEPSATPVPRDLSELIPTRPSARIESSDGPTTSTSEVDVTIDLDTPADQLPTIPVLELTDPCDGPVGLALVRHFRRTASLPADLQGGKASTRIVRDQDLLVVPPGARMHVRAATTPRWRTEASVLECPVVGAGVADDTGATRFELGISLWLPQGTDLVIWNDGPGQLVLLASRVPDKQDLVGRVLRQLG